MDTFVFLAFLAATSLMAGALYHASMQSPLMRSEKIEVQGTSPILMRRFGSEGVMALLAASICTVILSL